MEEAELTVGETLLLHLLCARYGAGEEFDLLADMGGGKPGGYRSLFSRHPDVLDNVVSGLAAKGLLVDRGSGLFSVTEYGEGAWKAIFPKWYQSRWASGRKR